MGQLCANGHDMAEGHKFCPVCGAQRPEANTSPASVPSPPAPRAAHAQKLTLEGDLEKAWRTFPDLPGIHAHFDPLYRDPRGSQLVTSNGDVLSEYRKRRDGGPGRELIVDGRFYELWHNGKRLRSSDVKRASELVDQMTGQELLRIESINFDRRARGVIHSSSHHYTFPVQIGRRTLRPARFAMMFTTNELGETVASYRRVKIPGRPGERQVEAVIPTDRVLTPELICLLSLSKAFFENYFRGQGGS
jgi:hypothetical protein